MAETGFSHRFTAYEIVGHIFGLSYRKISGGNQVKNSFFRISNISVSCPHAQLRSRTVIKSYGHLSDLGGRDRSQSPPCWIFQVKQIHPSTAPERTTRQISAHFTSKQILPFGITFFFHLSLIDLWKVENYILEFFRFSQKKNTSQKYIIWIIFQPTVPIRLVVLFSISTLNTCVPTSKHVTCDINQQNFKIIDLYFVKSE